MVVALSRRIVADLGGGTLRIAVVALQRGVRPIVGGVRIQKLKFTSAQEVIDHFFNELKSCDFSGQNRVVLSIAGPVDTAKGTIIKLTNHSKVDVLDIPLGTELARRLSVHFGKPIEVTLINDGEAGAWAEFNDGGALEALKPGELGMALIIGNGVGGRLYTRAENGDLVQVPGAFEPGHSPVDTHLLRELGLLDLLPASIKCGCDTVGIKNTQPYCFESVANGPIMEAMVKEFLERITISRYAAPGALPNLFIKRGVFEASSLVQAIVARTKLPSSSSTAEYAGQYTNADMTAALHKDARDSLAARFLGQIGVLYARRLEGIQRGFDDKGSITFALIGGIGVNWGPGLVPTVNDAILKMHDVPREVPVWASTPRVVRGLFPSDDTNLVGNAYYLAQQEANLC